MAQIKTYDAILPIGMSCATASQLKKRNLRMASFPFDWLMVPQINGLEIVLDLIQTHFKDFLNKEDLSMDLTYCVSGRYRVINQRNGIEFRHDFFKSTLTDEEITKNREKYQRRIDRFYETISQSSSVCLVLAMRCSEGIRERLIDTYKKIREMFSTDKIDLFAVIFEDETDGLEEISFDGGTIYLQHVKRQQNVYDIQERTWEFYWFDQVCLSDKFKTESTSLSYGAQAAKMTRWERLHYKIYRHMHKWLERHGVLRIRYDD